MLDVDERDVDLVHPQLLVFLGDHHQQVDVAPDLAADARPDYLDHHLAAVGQGGLVHLGDRSGCKWLQVEAGEQFGNRFLQRFFHNRLCIFARERRHLVLQLGELVNIFRGKQVGTGAHQLAQFDKTGTQLFHGFPDTNGIGKAGAEHRNGARVHHLRHVEEPRRLEHVVRHQEHRRPFTSQQSNLIPQQPPPSRVDVDMVFRDRSGMLASISQTISAEGSDILSCQLRTEQEDTGFAAMTIVVRDAPHLARILDRLQSLNGMLQVERRGQAP